MWSNGGRQEGRECESETEVKTDIFYIFILNVAS